MAVQQGPDPSVALYDLITSQRITAVIHVTAKLGIADLLAEGPKTPDELAQRNRRAFAFAAPFASQPH